jgi:uncharacterized protein YjlB
MKFTYKLWLAVSIVALPMIYFGIVNYHDAQARHEAKAQNAQSLVEAQKIALQEAQKKIEELETRPIASAETRTPLKQPFVVQEKKQQNQTIEPKPATVKEIFSTPNMHEEQNQNIRTAIKSQIDGEFTGWEGDTLYKLVNGQYWQQSSYHYHYHYAYSPSVLIYPSGGGYMIHVDEDDGEDISVKQVTDVIETRIEGDFNGWEGETVYPLVNGQIWQQSSYHYHYHYAYRPEVMIYPSGGGYKMHVKGDSDQEISVRRLK